MKYKFIVLLLLSISVLSCNMQQTPVIFSEGALNDNFTTLLGKNISFKNILEQNKNQTILIDIWASWCADCIKGLPKVKAIQAKYPGVKHVFLSLDKDKEKWKKGIEKYEVEGQHYFIDSGFEGDFGKFVNIDWIPRYIVINKDQTIKLFKATKADNGELIEALK